MRLTHHADRPPGHSVFERADRARQRMSLVDLDPDLFAAVGPRELARLREVAAPVVELPAGRWAPQLGDRDAGLGLIVLDGLLCRTSGLWGEVATELIGAGDLIRPWSNGGDADALVPCSVGWSVIVPARMAILGRQVALAASDCPGLVAALLDRTARRSRSQGILTAIAHMKRIDLRVLVLLWHLAERCGRVTGDGVTVPLRLTHQRIATLVGAQRPSVTAALSRMAARGLVERTARRGFVLKDAAREELEIFCREGERALAPLISACA